MPPYCRRPSIATNTTCSATTDSGTRCSSGDSSSKFDSTRKSLRSKSKEKLKSLHRDRSMELKRCTSDTVAEVGNGGAAETTHGEPRSRLDDDHHRSRHSGEKSSGKLIRCHTLPETPSVVSSVVKPVKSSDHIRRKNREENELSQKKSDNSRQERNRSRSKSSSGRSGDHRSKSIDGRSGDKSEKKRVSSDKRIEPPKSSGDDHQREENMKSKTNGTGPRRSRSFCSPTNDSSNWLESRLPSDRERFSSRVGKDISRNSCFDREKSSRETDEYVGLHGRMRKSTSFCLPSNKTDQQLGTFIVPLKAGGCLVPQAKPSSRNSPKASSRTEDDSSPRSTSQLEKDRITRDRKLSEIKDRLNRVGLSSSDDHLLCDVAMKPSSESIGKDVRRNSVRNSRKLEQNKKVGMENRLSCSDTNLFRGMESNSVQESTAKGSCSRVEREKKKDLQANNNSLFRRSSADMKCGGVKGPRALHRNNANGQSRNSEQESKELSCSDTSLLRNGINPPRTSTRARRLSKSFHDGSPSLERDQKEDCQVNDNTLLRRSSAGMSFGRVGGSRELNQNNTNGQSRNSEQENKELSCSDTSLLRNLDINPRRKSTQTRRLSKSFHDSSPSLEREENDKRDGGETMFRRSSNGVQPSQATGLDVLSGSLKPRSKNNGGEILRQGHLIGSDATTNGFNSSCPLLERKVANESMQRSSPTLNARSFAGSVRKLHKSKSLHCESQHVSSPKDESRTRQDRALRESCRYGRRGSMSASPERSTPLQIHNGRRRTLSHSERTPPTDVKTTSGNHFATETSSGGLSHPNSPRCINYECNQSAKVDEDRYIVGQREKVLTTHECFNETDNSNANASQQKQEHSDESNELETPSVQGEKKKLDLSARKIDCDMSLRELADALTGMSVSGKDLMSEVSSLRSAFQERIEGNQDVLLPEIIDDGGSTDSFSPHVSKIEHQVKSTPSALSRSFVADESLKTPHLSRKNSGRAPSNQSPHQEQKSEVGVTSVIKSTSPRPPPRQSLPCRKSISFLSGGEKTENSRGNKHSSGADGDGLVVHKNPPPPPLTKNRREHIATGFQLRQDSLGSGHETSVAKKSIPPPPPSKKCGSNPAQSTLQTMTSNERVDLLVAQVNGLKALSMKASTQSQYQSKGSNERIDSLVSQVNELKAVNIMTATTTQTQSKGKESLSNDKPTTTGILKKPSNSSQEQKRSGESPPNNRSNGDLLIKEVTELKCVKVKTPAMSQTWHKGNETLGNDKPKKTGILKRKSSNGNQEPKRVADLPYNDRSGGRGLYSGEVDEWGRPHGEGKMRYDNGEYYSGRWTNGVRTGAHPSNLNFFGNGGAVGTPGVIYNAQMNGGMVPTAFAGPMVACEGAFFQGNPFHPAMTYRAMGDQGHGQSQEIYPMMMNYPTQMHTPSNGFMR